MEEIAGLPEVGKLFTGYMTDLEQARQFDRAIDQLSLDKIWNGFVEAHGFEEDSSLNKFVLAHQLGKDLVFVASLFVGIGEINSFFKIANLLKKIKGVLSIRVIRLVKKLRKNLDTNDWKKLNSLSDLNEAFLAKLDGMGDQARRLLNDFDTETLKLFVDRPGLIDSWKVLDDAREANLADRLDDIEFVDDYVNSSGKTHAQVKTAIDNADGFSAWKLADAGGIPIAKIVDNYTPTFTGKIFEFSNADGSLYGRLYRQFTNSGKIEYTFKLTKPDGNIVNITGLTAEIDNGFIEIDLLLNQVKGKGVGKVIFDDVFKHFDGTGLNYQGFRGRWEGNNPNYSNGNSDNLTKYWQARNTKTKSESAFETWSGKRALENGFVNAKVTEVNTNLVLVEFTR